MVVIGGVVDLVDGARELFVRDEARDGVAPGPVAVGAARRYVFRFGLVAGRFTGVAGLAAVVELLAGFAEARRVRDGGARGRCGAALRDVARRARVAGQRETLMVVIGGVVDLVDGARELFVRDEARDGVAPGPVAGGAARRYVFRFGLVAGRCFTGVAGLAAVVELLAGFAEARRVRDGGARGRCGAALRDVARRARVAGQPETLMVVIGGVVDLVDGARELFVRDEARDGVAPGPVAVGAARRYVFRFGLVAGRCFTGVAGLAAVVELLAGFAEAAVFAMVERCSRCRCQRVAGQRGDWRRCRSTGHAVGIVAMSSALGSAARRVRDGRRCSGQRL